ncbi:MAG: polysaccharide biosynthesis tyrosine autokinase [Cyanobacteria bacterium RI_101]|nr:polysaccharide biosynthesis tyrosine autokinase [Cyanobacteria bacterium RI_101]
MPDLQFETAPNQKYPLAPAGNRYPILQNPLAQEGGGYPAEEDEGFDISNIIGILRRRWWIILGVGLIVGTVVGRQQFSKPPVYFQSFRLLVQAPSAEAPNPLAGAQQLLNQGRDNTYYQTQVQMMRSSRHLGPVAEQVRKEFFQGSPAGQNFSENYILEGLRIGQIEGTNLLEVGYSSGDPKLVKFVLSRLAETYVSNALEDQAISTNQRLSFVDKQIPVIKQKIADLEEQLKNFRLKTGFINPQAQGEILSQSLIEANKNRQAVDAEVQQANVLYENLRKQLGVSQNEALTINALTESSRYMSLIGKLREIDAQLAAESVRYTEENFRIQQLKEERKNLLPLINEEARIALKDVPKPDKPLTDIFVANNSRRAETSAQLIAAANARTQALARQKAVYASEAQARQAVQDFARSTGQYSTLTREMEIANQSLTALLSARQALEIEAARRFTPWRLVSKIEEPGTARSDVVQYLLTASLAGLAAGVAAALLAENLDRAFHDPDDITEKTGLPVLGMIPFMSTLPKLSRDRKTLITNDRQTPIGAVFLEAFSLLYTNLFLMRERRPYRSIVVSSAIPGEGKSTTSFFLAKGAANLGQRVLLIDGDRYFPQGNRWATLARLIGEDTQDLEEDVQSMEPIAMGNNLFVIRNDQRALNPNQLLTSQSLTQLIERWESEFDLVVVDAPPLLGITDTKLLARQADGMLLVVRMDKTNRDLIKQVANEMQIANIPIIGVVANGANHANSKYNYYYKYYRRAKYKYAQA